MGQATEASEVAKLGFSVFTLLCEFVFTGCAVVSVGVGQGAFLSDGERRRPDSSIGTRKGQIVPIGNEIRNQRKNSFMVLEWLF